LRVADDLKRQYTPGYYTTNTRKDCSFRKIKVEVTANSLRVGAKREYYAQGWRRTPRAATNHPLLSLEAEAAG